MSYIPESQRYRCLIPSNGLCRVQIGTPDGKYVDVGSASVTIRTHEQALMEQVLDLWLDAEELWQWMNGETK